VVHTFIVPAHQSTSWSELVVQDILETSANPNIKVTVDKMASSTH